MSFLLRVVATGLALLVSPCLAFAQSSAEMPVSNWVSPPFWSTADTLPKPSRDGLEDSAPVAVQSVEAVPTAPLPFTGINPCRIADTRGNGFSGAYGPPALAQGSPRNFVLTGQCGISASAQAVSLNITVTNTQGPGFILIYPQGGSQPTVSTLNYVAGQTIANAAVVPLGTGGGVTVIAGVSGTNLIIDTNGYYASQAVVNTVNGLSGAVTLAAGSNVSITPSGQTLTVASNGGPGGLLPAGSFGQTLRHDGISWVASDALRNDGTDISVSGVLRFPTLARATAGLPLLFHNAGAAGSGNAFFGVDAGNLSTLGDGGNSGFGSVALHSVTNGDDNTAMGHQALAAVQSGFQNTAVGSFALFNTTGAQNIALGAGAGINVTSGSNNMYLGNPGVAGESNTIRLGSGGVHTGLFLAGVLGTNIGSGTAIYINGVGQIGTAMSSARFKEDIRDMGDASARLLQLRPVTFRYRDHPDDPTQFGLIAEEVEKVLPELVFHNSAGEPESVLYHELPAMLVNEIQKQERRIEQEDAEIASLRLQLHALEERLSELSTR